MKITCKEDLDRIMRCGCGSIGCDHAAQFLHAKCHINSGLTARYVDGILHLSCAECGTPVVNVAVADVEALRAMGVTV